MWFETQDFAVQILKGLLFWVYNENVLYENFKNLEKKEKEKG